LAARYPDKIRVQSGARLSRAMGLAIAATNKDAIKTESIITIGQETGTKGAVVQSVET